MSLWWIPIAAITPGAVMAARSLWRERHRIPAAPDNQPGRDDEALDTCRRIPAQTRKENP
ncbi:hypothetical protein ABZ508_26520 [Streptomyces lavendulocolor]|uniref:Uncharacterized protein n=1 Tax=Streptomyces lavendulocolor TaxID=67316 RepID=A0ABV2WC41_9ACTN